MTCEAFYDLVKKYHFEIGNRFRYDRLCSDNDEQIVGHDVYRGLLICKSIKYFDWQKEEYHNHDIQKWADYIRCRTAYHWIQIDEHRNDIKQNKEDKK